ncbi:MAG: hypothetical protein AB7F99_17575 [Vicinamibacterales bacterium]
MRRVRALVIGYLVILLLAGWPILSVAIAGTIASWNGCELHEGFSNPCIVNGSDLGPTLYSMGVMGWFMIATIPLGAAAAIAWTLIWFVWRRLGSHKPLERHEPETRSP